MKIVYLLIFVLLVFKLFPDTNLDHQGGVIIPNGYRKFIYMGVLDDSILTIPSPSVNNDIPNILDVSLFLSVNNLSYMIQKKDDIFLGSTEFIHSLSESTKVISLNIISSEYIHHAIFYEHSGPITFDFIYVAGFSPIDKMGFKFLTSAKTDLLFLQYLALFEVSDNYTTPFLLDFDDGWRLKNFITIPTTSFLNIDIGASFKSRDLYISREYFLKPIFTVPYNEISLKASYEDREEYDIYKTQFSGDFQLKTDVWIFKNCFDFNVSYITDAFYDGSDNLDIIIFPNTTLSLGYKWEYITAFEPNFSSGLKIMGNSFILNIKYKVPLYFSDDKWEIEAVLTSRH
ncbi:MAG: hypothetical protein OCD02_01465 [Spirochaetaceae bacterium]